MPTVTAAARELHRPARRAERRGEAEEAVGHHQQQRDQGLGHVLVGDQRRVDLDRQGQPAEDGEGECDPSRAGDPVADPLQRGERGQQDELHQGDVRQDLSPVCHLVSPSSVASPRSPRPATVPSPGSPDPELLHELYSSPVRRAAFHASISPRRGRMLPSDAAARRRGDGTSPRTGRPRRHRAPAAPGVRHEPASPPAPAGGRSRRTCRLSASTLA